MNENIKYLLRICLYFFATIFSIKIVWSLPSNPKAWYDLVSEDIGYTLIFATAYIKFIWRFDKLNKMIDINGEYKGVVEYGESDKQWKETRVRICQDFLSVSVTLDSDEINSSTIIGNICTENSMRILYYTYIVNPKMKFSDRNPIHHGTCRIVLENPEEMHGTYWTSSKTRGDITLFRKK